MSKKLTITVDDEIYQGLHNVMAAAVAGSRTISRARTCFGAISTEGYRAMAAEARSASRKRRGVGGEPDRR